MSVTLMKRFQVRCDRCEFTVYVDDAAHPALPDGWGRKLKHGRAGSAFARYEDLCPTCHERGV